MPNAAKYDNWGRIWATQMWLNGAKTLVQNDQSSPQQFSEENTEGHHYQLEQYNDHLNGQITIQMMIVILQQIDH